ncbi:EpsG family protein [Rheinheimera sp.]|uniref:EpsG family protein n=1 Tax=Rheinheimera sp. TaxID=1869214 RepID=UPI0027B911B5|nr:EpsG family protein [Rheinheimera sp.]
MTTAEPLKISLVKAVMLMIVCIHTLFFYLYLSSNLGNLGLGDLGIYQIQFANIIKYNGLQNNTDPGFYYLMMFYTKYLSFELFVTSCFFVFYLSLIRPFYHLSEAKLLVVLLFIVMIYYPMYQSLSSLVLRQGMGFAFLMFSGFYFNSHRFLMSTLKICLAALFHLSLLFYVPVLVVNRMISSLKLLVFFWCGIVMLYVLEVPNAFVELLPGDLSSMVRAFNMVNDDYVVGFKPLFLLLSVIPFFLMLLRPYYYYVAADKQMFEILKIFFVANGAGLLCSGFPYYDRVMLFSWVLVPLIFVNFCGFLYSKLHQPGKVVVS